MKKRMIMLGAILAVTTLGFGGASAEPVCTDIACITVNEGGYIVAADGADGNPDPIDGYISVSSSGTVCADDNGSPGQSTSPTCGP